MSTTKLIHHFLSQSFTYIVVSYVDWNHHKISRWSLFNSFLFGWPALLQNRQKIEKGKCPNFSVGQIDRLLSQQLETKLQKGSNEFN